MFMAPASPRAGTNRIRRCRAIASRIGMLWIEMTPKTVVTPISARHMGDEIADGLLRGRVIEDSARCRCGEIPS